MRRGNFFWGLLFIGAAALIILNQFLGMINPFKLFYTIILCYFIIESIPRLNFFGILFPAGLLAIVYRDWLGISHLNTWTVLLASIFASIGLSLLFQPFRSRYHKPHHFGSYKETFEDINVNEVYSRVSFGSDTKYIRSQNLQKANLSCSFGSMKIFLDQAQLNPSGAEIYLDVSFGGVELFIPRDWHVVDEIGAFLGGVDLDRRFSQPSPSSPKLILKGNVSFGGIEVKFI